MKLKTFSKRFLIASLIISGSFMIAAMKPAPFQDTKNPDAHFAIDAAKGGKMEVDMGNQAQTKATNTRVKNFAAMMVRDHTKSNTELMLIIQSKKIDMEKLSDADHKMDNKMDMDKDFDMDYMDMMVNDHKKDIEKFKTESTSGKDAELKAFAAKTLPVLMMHLDSATAIYSSMKK